MRNYVLGLCLWLGGTALAQACSPVTLMVLNWPSAQFLAELDYLVLTQGFECDVERHAGTSRSAHLRLTDPAQTVLVPEYWQPPASEALHYKVLGQGPFESAGAGFYTQADWLEAYEGNPKLESILLEFGNPDQPASLMGCAQGWGCQIPVMQWFRALGLESLGWTLEIPYGRAEWLMRLSQAPGVPGPWIGYAIGPSPEVSRAGLVKLQPHLGFDPAHYAQCYQDLGCASPSPQSLPPSRVVSAASQSWIEGQTDVQHYLAQRRFDRRQTDRWMLYIDEGFTPEQAAIEFLATDDQWHDWVPEAVRNRILDDFN